MCYCVSFTLRDNKNTTQWHISHFHRTLNFVDLTGKWSTNLYLKTFYPSLISSSGSFRFAFWWFQPRTCFICVKVVGETFACICNEITERCRKSNCIIVQFLLYFDNCRYITGLNLLLFFTHESVKQRLKVRHLLVGGHHWSQHLDLHILSGGDHWIILAPVIKTSHLSWLWQISLVNSLDFYRSCPIFASSLSVIHWLYYISQNPLMSEAHVVTDPKSFQTANPYQRWPRPALPSAWYSPLPSSGS